MLNLAKLRTVTLDKAEYRENTKLNVQTSSTVKKKNIPIHTYVMVFKYTVLNKDHMEWPFFSNFEFEGPPVTQRSG